MTDLLADAVRRAPGAIAADDGQRRWSWAELDREAARWEARLRDAGARRGRAVALALHPSLEALAALHGALRTGSLVAPLNPTLTAAEHGDALDALRPAVLVDGRGLHPGPGGATAERPVDAPGDLVLWTSGTSGRPRGVLLTLDGLRASAEGARLRLRLASDDVWYASLSPAHVGGLALLTRAAILGCGLHLRGRFSLDDLVALIDAGAVTHASLVPTMLLRLLDARGDTPAPATLRCLLIGGAHTPPELARRALDAGLPIALTYGMTEASSQIATAPPDEVAADPTSVGRPLPGVEVRIDDTGGLRVRGVTLSPGLLGGEPLTDTDGWLETGDGAEWTADGRLRIVGRRSDRIVSGGVTVDAREVESALRAQPGVREACVVGVPDPVWGERVAALVVGGADPDALEGALRDRLSPAKRPRVIRSAEALPLNRNGKVDRAAVRALFTHGPGGPPSPERGAPGHGHR